jgi:hypothetical protein
MNIVEGYEVRPGLFVEVVRTQLEKSNDCHEPAGQSTGGQFCSTAQSSAETLDPEVATVGGDEWNKETAVRLEKEYQAAKPKLDALATKLASDPPLEVLEPAKSWGEISTENQKTVEKEYRASAEESILHSKDQEWRSVWNNDFLLSALNDPDNTAGQAGVVSTAMNEVAPEVVKDLSWLEPLVASKVYAAVKGATWDQSTGTLHVILDESKWAAKPQMYINARDTVEKKIRERIAITAHELPTPPQFFKEAEVDAKFLWDHASEEERLTYARSLPTNVAMLPKSYSKGLPTRIEVFDSNKEGYTQTKIFATNMVLERAAQLYKERDISPQFTPENIDEQAWSGWKISSRGREGAAMQVAAQQEFGVRPTEGIGWADDTTRRFEGVAHVGRMKALQANLRAEWEVSNYLLDKVGTKDVYVWRGLALEKNYNPGWDNPEPNDQGAYPSTSLKRNSLQSTTTDIHVANNWGGPQNRVVLRAVLPRTSVLSLPVYGKNVAKEQELVALGGAWKAWDLWKLKAPTFSDIPISIAKFNNCHNPEGPGGGRFCSTSDDLWKQPKPKRDFSREDFWVPEREWTSSMKRAIATGKVSVIDAVAAGYSSGDGHEIGEDGKLAWETLPLDLYHVTTNAPAIMQHGFKSRNELGQSGGAGLGGGSDDTVSFATDRAGVENIYHTMQEAHAVASGEITLADLLEAAKTGYGAKHPFWEEAQKDPSVKELLKGREIEYKTLGLKVTDLPPNAYFVGNTWMGGDGILRGNEYSAPLPEAEIRYRTFDAYKNFLQYRESAGGPENPLFFATEVNLLASAKPEDIAIIRGTPASDKAMGYRMSALSEWRTVGAAVTPREAERPEAPKNTYLSPRVKKFNNCHNPEGPGGGRFCSVSDFAAVSIGRGAAIDPGHKAPLKGVVSKYLEKVPLEYRVGKTKMVLTTLNKSKIFPDAKDDPDTTLEGVTDTKEGRTELFVDQNSGDADHLGVVALHEYGHSVDFALGKTEYLPGEWTMYSQQHSKELAEAAKLDLHKFQEAGDLFLPIRFTYAMSSPAELFAEAFAAVVNSGATASAPDFGEKFPNVMSTVKGWLTK